MPLTRRAAAIAASSGEGGAFVFNGGLTTSSLEYDDEEDNDARQGGAVDRSAKNPTAQTWDAKRMAEERQRLQLEEMKEQLKRLEEKLEEPLRRMAWQQHRMEEGFQRSSSLGSLGMQIAMGIDPFGEMQQQQQQQKQRQRQYRSNNNQNHSQNLAASSDLETRHRSKEHPHSKTRRDGNNGNSIGREGLSRSTTAPRRRPNAGGLNVAPVESFHEKRRAKNTKRSQERSFGVNDATAGEEDKFWVDLMSAAENPHQPRGGKPRVRRSTP